MADRKKFDKAFKEQTVERILAGEATASSMAKEIGVHYSTVRDWVIAYEKGGSSAFPGSGNLKPEDDEIRRLRRELANLKEENEILKKAAAYFAKNLKASKGRVARLMKTNGIRSKISKKYNATTYSNHNLPVAENILNQDFTANKPNQKWVSDTTYIPTKEGWLYLAGVMDLHGRKLVGWAMANHMRTELVSNALKQAVGRTSAK